MTSKRTTTQTPRPVPSFYTDQLFPGPLAERAIDREDTQRWQGWCAPFCDIEGSVEGMPVKEHGAYCQSRCIGSADGVNMDNQPDSIYADLCRHYTHGVYPTPVPAKVDYVRLYLDGSTEAEDDSGIFLTSGQVRVLAAQLVAAADILDRVGAPVGKKDARYR